MEKRLYNENEGEGYRWCQMLQRDLCKAEHTLQVINTSSHWKLWAIPKSTVKLIMSLH